jgi:cyclic beta-1,2-glucan synthetase
MDKILERMSGKEEGILTHFVADSGLSRFGETETQRLLGASPAGKNNFCRAGAAVREIRRNYRRIAALCLELTPAGAVPGTPDGPAGETRPPLKSGSLPELDWLLDNRYLIEREAREAEHALKHLRTPTALYALAKSLVKAGHGKVTPARIERFLHGVQKRCTLREEELYLLIPMLIAALVSEIAALVPMIRQACHPRRLKGDTPFAAERRVALDRSLGRDADPADEALATSAAVIHDRLSKLLAAMITSLRTLSAEDLSEMLQNASSLDAILRKDPAGIYPVLEEESRAAVRRAVSAEAKRRKTDEAVIANLLLNRAGSGTTLKERHVASPLYRLRRLPGILYVLGLVIFTAGAAALAAWWHGVSVAALLPVLLAVPLWFETVKTLCDAAALRLVRPRPLPRLELRGGIPKEARTLCVISALLTSPENAKILCHKLEQYRIANRDAGAELVFGLLCDRPDAITADDPSGLEAERAAAQGIEHLCKQYGGGFALFTRPRVFYPRDRVYMGRERKRGALMDLMSDLRAAEGSRPCNLAVTGDSGVLEGIRYLITLDSDTRLTIGSARQMVGTMLHPIHTPAIDPVKRIVVQGHALLQPRMAVDLDAAGRTPFARVFGGQGGLDPYAGASSDIYQDLFGEGSFNGKGIFDVDAALTCLAGRFPDARILSHDLLEGCYLRAGLMGDIELSDGCPSKLLAWNDRLHRWTRGDWQIASWLFPRVPGGQRNPLSALSRWKIFDNLRRSFTPVFLLLAMGIGFFSGSLPLLAAAAVCIVSIPLLSLSFAPARFHSRVSGGAKRAFFRAFLDLLFLPVTAYLCLHAMATVLWRLCVKRRLLRWVTADQSEAAKMGGTLYHYRAMWPCWLLAIGCLALASYPFFQTPNPWPLIPVLGIMWLTAPLAAVRLSKPAAPQQDALPGKDRAFLLRQAALMWSFFEVYLTPENHYLPPDNWQEQPAAGLARRTSPTNIGLGLLSAAAAADLSLCTRERAVFLIRQAMNTLNRLPHWNGHPFNWYDTATLKPLPPRYVSSVDSGNLAACLIVLGQTLREWEETELAGAAESFAERMRFASLYDEKRRLFRIGLSVDQLNSNDGGLYDLLASEARQTSYIAIARGEVERRHWRRLGRALATQDGYRGLVSWTGTMFEYLMPHLLMPCPPDSLLFESAHFAVHCHRRAVPRKLPWGISESAFYAFDGVLNYQYKAHGVPVLGLKRGLGRERVVAPYASYLALLVKPAEAAANLRRLFRLGMEGRFGLWEAIDFTRARNTRPHEGQIVRCVMSHHLGMSLLAVHHILRDGLMQRRFLRDTRMASFAELLQEKVPVGSVTLRQLRRESLPSPPRAALPGILRVFPGPNPAWPRVHLLRGGPYRLLIRDDGRCDAECGGWRVYRPESGGVQCFFEAGAERRSLYGGANKIVFTGHSAEYTVLGDTRPWESRGAVLLPADENGELRTFSLRNTGKETLSGVFTFFFEPVLAPARDHAAHPAFSQLFLSTSLNDGVLSIQRRPRLDGADTWMGVVCGHRDTEWDTSRQNAIRNGYRVVDGKLGAVADVCVLLQVPVTLPPGGSDEIRVALAVGGGQAEAGTAAAKILRMAGNAIASSSVPDRCLRRFGLTPEGAEPAYERLAVLSAPACNTLITTPSADGLPGPGPGQSALWRFGISGDLPVYGVDTEDIHRVEELIPAIRQHLFLRGCGFESDMVVLAKDSGEYRQSLRTALREVIRAIGGEDALGKPGGIHLLSDFSDAERELFLRFERRWVG